MNEIEFVESFFSDSSLRTPGKFFRISKGGARYYIDSDFNPRVGITSFLSRILPTPYNLRAWRDEVGAQEAQRILYERAKYGTTLHHIIAEVLKAYKRDGVYKIPLTFKQIFAFGVETEMINELQGDLAAFADFCETYKPDPILIETPLGSTTTKLAATLDFFGTIEVPRKWFWGEVYKSGIKKGEPKETTKIQKVHAVIDFKSMRKKEDGAETKAIGKSNEFQLNYQLLFLLENYPEFEKEEILMFNAVPKNWRTSPSVQMTEVTPIPFEELKNLYSVSKYIDPYIVEKIEESKVPVFSEYNGDISEACKLVTFKEYIQLCKTGL